MTINNDKKITILVVDDVQDNIEVLENTLDDYYKVLTANSGEEALDVVQKNPDISVILLDIMMPGMDGYEVIKRLKRSNATKHIPVIFISAKERVNDEVLGFSLGAADYISKPFSPAITLARVKTHLRLYEQHRQLEQQNIYLKRVNSNLKKITEQNSKDSLTGLEREPAFHSIIKQMFTQRSGEKAFL